MPLIMCTKFQTNHIILTLFPGVWDKNFLKIFSFLKGLGFSFQVTLNNESFDLENSFLTVDSFLRYL